MPKLKKQNKKEPVKSFRPPIVAVLGHVDHGKSSLLEAIKNFRITAKESGGITQHIGAYEVENNGKKITFIDTPGHEAFSAMRARGANVADIALLVIDAAQSIQPQTKEAATAIKRAGIPMIVVLNKVDLPTANPEKVKRDLMNIEIIVESLGGQVPCVNVSAREKTGIDELLEIILLVSELQELVSDTESKAEGLIIESYMDAHKGPVATAIIQKGILKAKDVIATDLAQAKVKMLKDFQGKDITEAVPSQPVIILGFETVPAVGEKFKSYGTSEEATNKIKTEAPKRELGTSILEVDPLRKTLPLIIKGDVFGSLEAIESMLKSLPQDKVMIRILKVEVGDIVEADVKLAEMSKADIIGFRVKINPSVASFMKNDTEKKIRIKAFDVIYELIQDVRHNMERSLSSELVKQETGKLKTLLVFMSEKNRQIVGGKITEGEFKRGGKLEVYRNDQKIGTGKIVNLQRDKKDIDKLGKGSEAGILFEGSTKIEKGDIIVTYIEERKKDTL